MARAIGINHVALEVSELEPAVDFYRSLFGFPLRGRAPGMAFLDMGDQFLAIPEQPAAKGMLRYATASPALCRAASISSRTASSSPRRSSSTGSGSPLTIDSKKRLRSW